MIAASNFDEVLPLAHALHSTPGSHAFLLGAGVSIASGVPSAWGVVTELAGQIAHQRIEPAPTEDSVAGWYQTTFGADLRYESLLAQLAPTQTERQQLLRQFFEDDVRDPDAAPIQPSAAHVALARLVAAGSVNIILTLNFDRLMEMALIAEGIQPIVASTPSQLRTLAPLHTIRALVVHLHGDYLEPLSMKNTAEELDHYEQDVDKFLDEVLTNYGLVAVGWSATYDPAMRQAITRNTTRVFTGYFINPGHIDPAASDLISQRGMTLVPATADDAIGHLADSVTALNQRRARHPLTVVAAMETAKRQLGGAHVAIPLHDSIKHELERVRGLPELDLSIAQRGSGSITDARAVVTEHSQVAAGLIAAAAYWGDDVADTWWSSELATFTARPRVDGILDWLDLPKLAGALFFHAAGVASTAAGRYDLTQKLLVGLLAVSENGSAEPISKLLAPPSVSTGSRTPSFAIFTALREIFVSCLALGQRGYEAAWEEFEFLRLVVGTLRQPGADTKIKDIVAMHAALPPDRTGSEYLLSGLPTEQNTLAASQRQRREALEALDRAENELADLVSRGDPHLRCLESHSGALPGWQAVVGRRLALPAARARGILWGILDQIDDDGIIQVVRAVSQSVGRRADTRSTEHLVPGTAGALPDYFWLDTMEVPGY